MEKQLWAREFIADVAFVCLAVRLKHEGVIDSILILNSKQNTIPATRKKIKFIPGKIRNA